MPGKKNKGKSKGVTLSLSSFLNDGNSPAPDTKLVSTRRTEDGEDGDVIEAGTYQIPTAPRSRNNIENVPREPPFKAHVSNLPFDYEESDLRVFFGKCDILSINMPMDRGATRSRGFGYVEFATQGDLIEALELNEEVVRGRNIRVTLPNEREGGREDRYNRRDNDRYGDREEREERSAGVSDWRRAPPDQRDNDQERNGGRFGGGGGGRFDDDRRRGGGGGRYDGGGYSERSTRADDEPWRRGPPAEPDSSSDNRGGYRGRYNDGGDFDRSRMDRRGGFERQEEPKERPKLQLKKRTVPLEDNNSDAPAQNSSIFGEAKPVDTASKPERSSRHASPVSKPSAADIFGAAKPVDTAAKEKEISERLTAKKSPQVPKKETADIFGAAKPVDTSSREREIEERVRKQAESAAQQAPPPPQKADRWRDRPAKDDREDDGPRRGGDSYRGGDSHRGGRGDRDYGRDMRGRNNRDDYGRDRNNRDDYGRDRNNRDDYGRDRNNRDDYGRDRNSRDDYGRDRNSRDDYGRDRNNRDDYGRDRNNRDDYGRNNRRDDRSNGNRNHDRYSEDNQRNYSNGDEPAMDSDEERFLRKQPKNRDTTVSLDMKNKFGNLDLEEEMP